MGFKNLLAILFVLPLCACASTNLRLNDTLVNKTYNASGFGGTFQEETFGSALYASAIISLSTYPGSYYSPHSGMARSFTAPEEKQKLVKKYDPTEKIKLQAEDVLAKRLNIKRAANFNQLNSKPDLVIALRGTWGIKYHPIMMTRYSVYYAAVLDIQERMLDEKHKPKSTQFNCGYKSTENYDYDEVYAQGATIVDEHMKKALDVCVKKLVKDINERIDADKARK